MLGATDVVMKGLMGQGGGGYLVGGVECLRMEVEVRDEVTRCIKQISNHVGKTMHLFANISCNEPALLLSYSL